MRIPVWIPLVFCTTGFAALLYQVVWQRVLYSTFGVNVEAVTTVVTAFLAGLGVGSLAGGRLARGTNHSYPPHSACARSGSGTAYSAGSQQTPVVTDHNMLAEWHPAVFE